MNEPEVIRLLKNSFTEEEWQYLERHPEFQKLIDEHNGSSEGFGYLVESGELLLRQKKDLDLE